MLKNTGIYMEIIKRGTLPSEKMHTTTCGNCKTEFRFMEHEAQIMNDRNEICLVVKCPVCRKEIWKKK